MTDVYLLALAVKIVSPSRVVMPAAFVRDVDQPPRQELPGVGGLGAGGGRMRASDVSERDGTVGAARSEVSRSRVTGFRPQERASRVARLPFAALALSAIACGDAVNCVSSPCPLMFALSIAITSSVSSGGITGSFVQITGSSSPIPCSTSCMVPGSAGTYEVDIGAPGFQTVHRSVTVTGSSAGCGTCGFPDTQHLAIVLVPTP